MSMKNSSDTTTRDIRACSAVPQPAVLLFLLLVMDKVLSALQGQISSGNLCHLAYVP
jgi:hypothetical protein